MRNRNPALLLTLILATCCAGCIVLARETYTSLRGPDAVAVEPQDLFEVSAGRKGHSISHSPSLARASFGPRASVTAGVCDWDEGIWFIAFPPLPIPLLTPGDTLGRPGTTLVRLSFDGDGTWNVNPASLVLVGSDGRRAVAERYRLERKRLDRSLEPCAADVAKFAAVEGAELAVVGAADLWLRFPTLDWPETPRTLELDGLTLGEAKLPAIRLDFDPGARWFWYQVFP